MERRCFNSGVRFPLVPIEIKHGAVSLRKVGKVAIDGQNTIFGEGASACLLGENKRDFFSNLGKWSPKEQIY